MFEKMNDLRPTSRVVVGEDGTLIEQPIFYDEQGNEVSEADMARQQEMSNDMSAASGSEYDAQPEETNEELPEKKPRRKERKQRAPKETAEWTRKDRMLRSIGSVTVTAALFTGIPVASAYVANQAVTKLSYDVDLTPMQQLSNFADLPGKTIDMIEDVTRMIEFTKYLGVNEVTGEAHD